MLYNKIKIIVIGLLFLPAVAFGIDHQVDNLVVVGSTTYQGQLDMNDNKIINLSSPTAGTDAVNKSYSTSTVAGLNISDTPADDEIMKYDSASGKVIWKADNEGGGEGTTDEYIALYEGMGGSQIYASSDTNKAGGNWQGCYGSAQKLFGMDFVVDISSEAPTGVNVNVKLDSSGVYDSFVMRTLDSTYGSDWGIWIYRYDNTIATAPITAGTTYYAD